MFKHSKIAALATVGVCLAVSAASAKTSDWPASIVGTWEGISNLTPVILTVTTQTAGGKCQSISGTLNNANSNVVNPILGYYCPDSGAVEFLRYPTNSSVAFQVYTANLAQVPLPKHTSLLMGGQFGQYSLAYGPLGQFSFAVSK
jgi:hypothetical protein